MNDTQHQAPAHESAAANVAQEPVAADAAQAPPSEEELRAAYEAELKRITSSDLVIQTTVSLLNVGGRRLGLAPGSEAERDLEQVRDAIDGVRALMPILERRMPDAELRPLRDALAQLQMAYAREAAAKPHDATAEKAAEPEPAAGASGTPDREAQPPAADAPKGPGPAEASGRLWVPGR